MLWLKTGRADGAKCRQVEGLPAIIIQIAWVRASAPAAMHHHCSMLSVTVIISSGCTLIMIQQTGLESKKYWNWP